MRRGIICLGEKGRAVSEPGIGVRTKLVGSVCGAFGGRMVGGWDPTMGGRSIHSG
jgi:hypothetical protein